MFSRLKEFFAALNDASPEEAVWDDSVDEALNLSLPDPDLAEDDTLMDGDDA